MSQPHFFYFKKPLFFLVVHILPSKTKYKYVVHRRDLYTQIILSVLIYSIHQTVNLLYKEAQNQTEYYADCSNN